jgi:CHAD domain-containing protein
MTTRSKAAPERPPASARSARIEQDETVERGSRRLVRAELAEAARLARDESVSEEERVHEVRLCLKRARAVVALVAPAVGPRAKRENARLREIARALGPARDEVVARETLARLTRPRARQRPADPAAGDAALQSQLLRALSVADAAASLRVAARGLERTHRDADRWRVPHGRRAARAGLERTFRRARRDYRRARVIDDATCFHEWRKAVKRLQYQTAILSARAPGATLPGLKDLGRVLGELHDVDVLRAIIVDAAQADHARAARDELLRRVDDSASRLRRHARTLGSELFEERPSEVGRRLDASWSRRHG